MQENVYRHIATYATPSNIRGGIEFGTTLALWVAMFWTPWWTAPVHALLMTRLFVVGVHDPGHRSLMRSPMLNDWILRIASPLVCMPGLSWWRPSHNHHHRYSNDLSHNQGSQTAPLTVAKFRALPVWKQTIYRYATYPVVLMTQIAPVGMTVGQILRTRFLSEAIVQALFFGGLVWMEIGVRYCVIASLAASFGVFLFHLQHTFPDCVRSVGKDAFANGYSGSSFLQIPEWLKLFMAGIEYHHIHHLNTRVPSYRLRACHESAPVGMWDGVRRITLQEGWSSLSLVLWSNAKNRLVTFEEVDKEILLT